MARPSGKSRSTLARLLSEPPNEEPDIGTLHIGDGHETMSAIDEPGFKARLEKSTAQLAREVHTTPRPESFERHRATIKRSIEAVFDASSKMRSEQERLEIRLHEGKISRAAYVAAKNALKTNVGNAVIDIFESLRSENPWVARQAAFVCLTMSDSGLAFDEAFADPAGFKHDVGVRERPRESKPDALPSMESDKLSGRDPRWLRPAPGTKGSGAAAAPAS